MTGVLLEDEVAQLRCMVLGAAAYLGNGLLLGADPTLFGWAGHRDIADTIGRLHDAGDPVDPVTVGASLTDPSNKPLVARACQAWVESSATSRTVGVLVDRLAEKARWQRILAITSEVRAAIEAGNDPQPHIDQLTGGTVRSSAADPIDWAEFWATDPTEGDWLAEPLIAEGRSTLLFAKHKTGKSLLVLDIVAAVTTGTPILGQPNPNGPRTVLVLDWEMTEADLRERLEDFGYGPSDDLSHLRYVFQPFIDPLDTRRGGEQLLQLAQHHVADLVVLDTFGRAVQGDENDADTVRDYYRHTASKLKAHGVAVLRTDHAGWSTNQHARGSSAKGDDVDIIVSATSTETGLRLKRTARMAWANGEILITRDDHGRHRIDNNATIYRPGTKELAALLDQLEVPLDASRRIAQGVLREHGQGRQAAAVGDALKWRRAEAPRYQP